MKAKLLSLAMVLALVAALFTAPTQVKATGYGTAFATSITFQNLGTADATLYVTFYPAAGGTPIEWTPAEGALKPNAGSSLYVGNVSGVGTGFQGSAVMTSNQPMAAVLVQIPQAPSTVKNRPLSTGLSTGAANVLIPTVLKNTFGTHSIFVVQNADSVPNDLTLSFVPVSGSTINVEVDNLGPGLAKYYDMSKVPEIAAATFNGSVVINAWKDGTAKTSPANGAVVATSLELALTSDNVYAFEGISQPGNTLYMPSAFCQYGAGGAINTAYAVQNTEPVGGANAVVTVTYSPGGKSETVTIAPGAKASLLGCGQPAAGARYGTLNNPGFIGSAVISSTGGQIVGIGKVSGNGISSAFNGLTAGASKVALPYVRWTEANWRTANNYQVSNIAIQNVGAEIPAGQSIVVTYYDKTGTEVGKDTLAGPIAAGGKVNSNPKKVGLLEFGQPAAGSPGFGGGAVVTGPAGSQLAVLVRVETFNLAAGTGSFGEDYNGIPVP